MSGSFSPRALVDLLAASNADGRSSQDSRADEAIGRILADPASYTVGAAPPAGTVEGEDKADDNPAR